MKKYWKIIIIIVGIIAVFALFLLIYFKVTFIGKDAVKNLNEGFRHAVFRNPSSAIDKKIEDVGTPFELVERLILSVGQPAAEALIKSKEDKGA